MADATVIDRLRLRAVHAHRGPPELSPSPSRPPRPDPEAGHGARTDGEAEVLHGDLSPCFLSAPRASIMVTLLLRRVSTRLRRSPDPASARSSNWAYCTCSTRQTTKPAIARTAGLLAPILAPTARHLRSIRRLKRRHRHARTGFPAVASGSEPLPRVRAPGSGPGGHGDCRPCQGMVRCAGISTRDRDMASRTLGPHGFPEIVLGAQPRRGRFAGIQVSDGTRTRDRLALEQAATRILVDTGPIPLVSAPNWQAWGHRRPAAAAMRG